MGFFCVFSAPLVCYAGNTVNPGMEEKRNDGMKIWILPKPTGHIIQRISGGIWAGIEAGRNTNKLLILEHKHGLSTSTKITRLVHKWKYNISVGRLLVLGILVQIFDVHYKPLEMSMCLECFVDHNVLFSATHDWSFTM
jgi:hypothetical protein